jgi:hypothetical protein
MSDFVVTVYLFDPRKNVTLHLSQFRSARGGSRFPGRLSDVRATTAIRQHTNSVYLLFYDTSEVLSLLRLGKIPNKAQLDLSHKILNTPMGVLMEKAPVERIDVYETVFKKVY